MSRAKFEKQLLGGIEEDETANAGVPTGGVVETIFNAVTSAVGQGNSAKKEEFRKMAQYVQGKYDEDEGFERLEKKIGEIEKEDFGGKKADRVYYVGGVAPLLVCVRPELTDEYFFSSPSRRRRSSRSLSGSRKTITQRTRLTGSSSRSPSARTPNLARR